MAKKKVLTQAEKNEYEKNLGLNFIKEQIDYINEPTYSFNIGDKVQFGNMKEATVQDIFYDGKVYGLKCIASNSQYYTMPGIEEVYRVATWTEIRSLTYGDTNFATNQDVQLRFNNSTIESLLHKCYSFGVDFNPDYQRDYVWTVEDKELLLDSVFKNIDIGKFVFVNISDDDWQARHVSYEILDGKQRLSTLIEFYENRIKYKGKFYNELSGNDRYVFKHHSISVAEVDATDKQTILKYFLMLNRTGKVMSSEHLETVELMLNKIATNTI